MNKKNIVLIALLPITVFAILFISVYKTPYVISQIENGKNFNVITYTDSDKGGNSKIQFSNNNNNGIQFTYTLGDSTEFPYAGIMFSPVAEEYLDLSAYTDCSIKISVTDGARIPFYIFTSIENFSSDENIHSYYPPQYTLVIKDKPSELTFKLKDYVIPNWWYSLHNKTVNDFKTPDFSKVSYINISNSTQLGTGIEAKVNIFQMKFYVDMIPYYIYFAIFIVIYTFAIFAYSKNKKNHGSKETKISSPIFTYTKIETQNNSDRESDLIFNFINTSYSQPELSITDVRNKTNISERKISAIIKEKTGMNFKQFLNTLRIVEAKRLLQETDLQISEIAYKTGYSNTSHFNRVFKNAENVSPGSFRKKV